MDVLLRPRRARLASRTQSGAAGVPATRPRGFGAQPRLVNQHGDDEDHYGERQNPLPDLLLVLGRDELE